MEYLSNEQVKDISFPDAPVEGFEINEGEKSAKFVSDAFVGEAPTGKWFDDSTVTISFSSVQITEEDEKTIHPYASEYALTEICEFIIEENRLIVRGFTVGPGLWTEFVFSNPTIKVCNQDGPSQNAE